MPERRTHEQLAQSVITNRNDLQETAVRLFSAIRHAHELAVYADLEIGGNEPPSIVPLVTVLGVSEAAAKLLMTELERVLGSDDEKVLEVSA